MKALKIAGLFALFFVLSNIGVEMIRVDPEGGFDWWLVGGVVCIFWSLDAWHAAWKRILR